MSSKRGLCLDVGCGSGVNICPIVKNKLYEGVSLDPMLKFLYILKEKVANNNLPIHMIRGVGEYLPIKDHAIELVIITATLDHVNNPELVLSETSRVLNADGYLQVLQTIVRSKRKRFSHQTHLWQFKKEDLTRMLEGNYSVKKIRFFYSIPLPLVSRLLMIIPKLYDVLGMLINYPTIALIKAKMKTENNSLKLRR